MTKQYTPQNSKLSIVNRPDVTDPLFIPRYTLRLVPGRRPSILLLIIRDSSTAATALRPFFAALDREQFLIACLDVKHAIIGVSIVSIGPLTLSIVHPREVFKAAILLNTAAIICAHNHPSGDQEPSSEDRVLTVRLRQAGELLGITVLDHIILGDDRTYSFADQGRPA
jgi:DNA repair protein RadC